MWKLGTFDGQTMKLDHSVTYPLDITKTRLQIARKGAGAKHRTGMFRVTYDIGEVYPNNANLSIIIWNRALPVYTSRRGCLMTTVKSC